MPTFIKTGFWEKAQKGLKGWLDLERLIIQIAGEGGGTWGNITGTVTNQTDLVNYIQQQIDEGSVPYEEGSYTVTHTGFSVDPVVVGKYTVIGDLVTVHYAPTVNGTSNAATYTITLPFTSVNTTSQIFPILVVNNGSIQTTPGKMAIAANTNIGTISLTLAASGGFTTSGSKGSAFVITYKRAI